MKKDFEEKKEKEIIISETLVLIEEEKQNITSNHENELENKNLVLFEEKNKVSIFSKLEKNWKNIIEENNKRFDSEFMARLEIFEKSLNEKKEVFELKIEEQKKELEKIKNPIVKSIFEKNIQRSFESYSDSLEFELNKMKNELFGN